MAYAMRKGSKIAAAIGATSRQEIVSVLTAHMDDGETVTQIASRYGVSHQVVSYYLKEKRREELKKIGCSECKTNPHARGLCRKCYRRAHTAGVLANYPYQLKPIGCEKCKTNPYARKLCRNCYARQQRRNNHRAAPFV